MVLGICFSFKYHAQNKEEKKRSRLGFDEIHAIEIAKQRGVHPQEIEGYIQFLKNDFSSKQALQEQSHNHSPSKSHSNSIQETVIYLEPNKPMSLGCPNMSFEQYNFNGWTGGTGTVSTGTFGGNPNYNSTGATIINAAGDNVSVLNTVNFHTIMNIPPTSNVYPNCIGYDSLAVRAVGTTTISDIPFVSPYSFDPVSVRLNSVNGNYSASRLKYITTTSSNNTRISFSYAVILNDPVAPAHAASEAPYFKVNVRNETTGLIIPGCSSDDFNPKTANASDSLLTSVIKINGADIKYRKWYYYSVDLSSLPLGTSVSINFEVGGCTLGSHAGYAYVDAECGGSGTAYSNMCSGSSNAILVAPSGFVSYQWFNSSGIIAGEVNDTLNVNPATPGTTYTVNMVSPAGCIVTQTVNVSLTTVNIININSTSSCNGGNTGATYVQASGSSGVYTYTWTNTSTGATVSNSQTATGLAPGSYSVLVASTSCGQASANLFVGVSPPFFLALTKTFCGNSTFIPQTGGSNYKWYKGTTPITSPLGINDTLFINNAMAGEQYTVVYNSSLGCRDSITYTLNKILGGDVYFSSMIDVCPNNSNGSAVLTFNTPYPSPYNYFIVGPSSANIVSSQTTSATSLTLTNLSAGTYTSVIKDGVCLYTNTVTINSIQTNFTVNTTNTVSCFPDPIIIKLDVGTPPPLVCGLDQMTCSGNQVQLFSSGIFNQNGPISYPTPYGNWFTHARSQYLVRKSELNAAGIFAGKLSSIAFNILNLNSSSIKYPNFSIKMGCTNSASFPNASIASQAFVSGLQTVYSNSNQTISLGWETYYFNQPYVWDGNSNIIIEVCFSFPNPTGLGNFSENVSVQLKQMPYIANMYRVEDANPVCGGSQPANNGIGSVMANGINMLPNMRFGYCGYMYSPSTSYSVNISPNGTITANYGNDSILVAPTFTSPPLPSGSVIYSVSVINPIGGCVETKTVEVIYPPLTSSITASISNSVICLGQNTTLNVTGASTYNWYYLQGGNLIPVSTSSLITVTPPVEGISSYVVIGQGSCSNSTPDTKTITVNVIPITNLNIAPLKDVIKCLNKSTVLSTSVTSSLPANSGTPYSYLWTTIPGNNPASGINAVSDYTCNANSTTTLVVTVNGVCANSNSDTVVVNNLPDDLMILISDSSTTCSNTPFVLNSITTGGYPIYNYSWYVLPNTNSISSDPSLSYISPESEGTYSVAVYVNDSCGYQKSDIEIIVVLPPCHIIIPNIITPNGDNANDFFKIKNLEFHPNTQVSIFDRWGKKVYENPNYNNEWKAEGLGDGTFFYIIDVPDDKIYSGFLTVLNEK